MRIPNILKAALLAVAMTWSVLASAAPATVVPSKNYVTVPVKVNASFDGLCTNTAIDIEYTVGPQKVQLHVPDNLAKYVKVTVTGGNLTVSYSENMNIQGNHKTILIVSAPDVSRFTVGSAGDITVKSDIKTNKAVSMMVKSAGDIKACNINAPTVNLTTSSAGDIVTKEILTDEANLIVNSAGDISTGDIRARKQAKLTVNSAGDIDVPSVLAGEDLVFTTNSAGDIKVKEASADHATLTSNSSGNVKVTDLTALNVKLTCLGAGDIRAGGICSYAEMSNGSSGDIEARNLKATSVYATVMSSGGIDCYAVESLQAYRKSIGTIRYAGNPAEIIVSSTRRDDGVYPL